MPVVENVHIILIAAVALSVVGTLLWRFVFSPDAKARRALRSNPRVMIGEAPDGKEIKIVGELRYADKTPLKAPLSKRSCALYELKIEQKVSSGKSSYWKTIVAEKDHVSFWIEDPSGRAFVDPVVSRVVLTMDANRSSGFLDDATPDLKALLGRHGHSSQGWVFNKTLRFSEGVLEEGEIVAVMGRCQWQPDPDGQATVGSFREPPRRLAMGVSESGELLITDDVRLVR